jgi:hypothetical protein
MGPPDGPALAGQHATPDRAPTDLDRQNTPAVKDKQMTTKFDARRWLEASLEDEKAELLEKLQQAVEKTRILGELQACESLLKRIREMPIPA